MIVLENGFPIITSAGDVINSARVFYAEGAYHIGIISRYDRNIKTKDLTLFTEFGDQTYEEDTPISLWSIFLDKLLPFLYL